MPKETTINVEQLEKLLESVLLQSFKSTIK